MDMTATYPQVEKLIYSTIHKFLQQHRGAGEFEDLVSVSNEVFVSCCETYDATKGQFSNWLRFKIWHTLLESSRREAVHHRILPRTPYDDIEEPARRQTFLIDLMDELSEDARTVAKLALDAPFDVRLGTAQRGGTTHGAKTAIKEYLQDTGWATTRITESFNEIRKALQ